MNDQIQPQTQTPVDAPLNIRELTPSLANGLGVALSLASESLSSGKFAVAPVQSVGANSTVTVLFEATNRDGALVGPAGSVVYNILDGSGTTLNISFDIPIFGTDRFTVGLQGPNAGKYQASAPTVSGKTPAPRITLTVA